MGKKSSKVARKMTTLELFIIYIEKVRDFNKTLGVYDRCKAIGVQTDTSQRLLDMEDDEMFFHIESRDPEKFLAYAIEREELSNTDYIYIEIEQLLIESNINFLKKLKSAGLFFPKLFIVDSAGIGLEPVEEILNMKTRIVYVKKKIVEPGEQDERVFLPIIKMRADGSSTHRFILLSAMLLFNTPLD